ncbi:MAG: alpha/beta fold hydrolase [Myxococcales bacterium]|nr:alpha/beta fold hydrolase [Myxococcales bacterium]
MGRPSDPFALGDGPDACLLLHGLTGSPAEVRPVGEALAQSGFRTIGPLLPGHGTSPGDLYTVTRNEMIRAAESAFASLEGARRVFVCGLSMGALLTLHLAAHHSVSGIALLAPAIDFTGATWFFTEILGRLPALPFIVGKTRDLENPGEIADGSYHAIPLRWGPELHELSQYGLKLAHRVRAPALIVQGARDQTVAPAGSRKLLRELASPHKELRILPRSGHVLPLDVESDEVCRLVVQHFREVEEHA